MTLKSQSQAQSTPTTTATTLTATLLLAACALPALAGPPARTATARSTRAPGESRATPPRALADAPPTSTANDSAALAPTAPDPAILALRETAWRAWFAGDDATLAELLPPEFVGIGMGDGPFDDLPRTLAASRAFHAAGGRLLALDFPQTQAQRFGNVVVFYGRFSLTLVSDGKEQQLAGRLTEIFVEREGRWWHPGWHLDLVDTP